MKYVRVAAALLIIAVFASIFVLPNFTKVTPAKSSPKSIGALPAQNKPYPVPVRNINFTQPPQIWAASALVVDAKTGNILYQKDPDIHHMPASTLKLMTALVALENCPLNKIVTVNQVETTPSSMGLTTGDQLTIEALLNGLLINSGNDAAYTLAYSCAPTVDDFVAKMNAKAKQLGMESTRFTNPIGFDDPAQYSTASDLARLAQAAIANPQIAKIVDTQSAVVANISGTKNYYLDNVNKLLGQVPGLIGIKTGETPGALGNLITETTRNDDTIIAVVLGSYDRFGESKTLIEWVFANYHWL